LQHGARSRNFLFYLSSKTQDPEFLSSFPLHLTSYSEHREIELKSPLLTAFDPSIASSISCATRLARVVILQLHRIKYRRLLILQVGSGIQSKIPELLEKGVWTSPFEGGR